MQWWRELDLPTRIIIDHDDRLRREIPEQFINVKPWADLTGEMVFSIRTAIVKLLRASGDLGGEPKSVSRPMNFYEKGDKPLGIVVTRQWYLSSDGRGKQSKTDLLERGAELAWTLKHMRHRYDNWVGGLNGDWLISQQRLFGVPFPVWYPLGADGKPLYSQMIVTGEANLPVDPTTACPPGYEESQRGVPGGSIADPDVMDTWAASSLAPQIASGWERNKELLGLTFPTDVAPQGHDIIRIWLLPQIVHTNFGNHSLSWRRTIISGFVTDLDRKKVFESKGNVVVPSDISERFGSDAIRWHAAMARPGTDPSFDQSQIKVRCRLVMKILNAGGSVLGLAPEPGDPATITSPVDGALLTSLPDAVIACMEMFDAFDYTQALETAETFLWSLCGDYLELAKERACDFQGPETQASAQSVLIATLGMQLRLFVPFLPFVTEETWSWTHGSSVHRSLQPTAGELAIDGDRQLLANVVSMLITICDVKPNTKVSMKTPARKAVFLGDHAVLKCLKAIEAGLHIVDRITGEMVRKIAEESLIVETELEKPPVA